MEEIYLKKILNSREAQPTLNAFSGNLGKLDDKSSQKDDVNFIINRLNHGDASFVHESWQKLTGGFDLDKIERIINGIEDDGMLDAIVRIIKSEYLRLVKQRKIKTISRQRKYMSEWGQSVYDECFEELINDFITHRKEIKEALQNEKEEREKAASFFSIFYDEEDRKESFAPLSPNFLPSDKELDGQTERLWAENNAQRAIIDEQHTTIAQLKEEAEKLKQSNTLLKKQIKNLKKKDAQILKENKKHLQEIENLKKINSTQEKTITQLRQQLEEAESTDLFLSAEEANTVARMRAYGFKGTNKELLDSIRHEEEIITIEALESKNRELVQKMNELLEEKGNTTVKIEDIMEGLKKIPNPVEKLLVMEKLGFYVFVNTPLGEQIRELIEEMCKNQQEIQNKQNIMINQLVTGNGTQNITNANMG
jgi:Chromosome segregation ATPases